MESGTTLGSSPLSGRSDHHATALTVDLGPPEEDDAGARHLGGACLVDPDDPGVSRIDLVAREQHGATHAEEPRAIRRPGGSPPVPVMRALAPVEDRA